AGDVLLDGDELRSRLADLAARLPEARTVAGYSGALALLAYLPGHSTTELIERIVQRYGEPEAGKSIQDTAGTNES
ncbi:MAG TPA: hypothetical protein VKT52_00125, partial [Ktedonobacterales bacterium]|nr:hypothetical protein [Ktedonobacterales bacterium]